MTKLKFIIPFIVFAITLALIYAGVAFVAWDWNPEHWKEGARVSFVVAGGGIASAFAVVSMGLQNENASF